MSDDTPEESQSGSTAAEAAHTQEIPRVTTSSPAKKSAPKKTAKKPAAKKTSSATATSPEASDTDQVDTDDAATTASSAKDDVQVTTDEARSAGASSTEPLTAGDYARTTKPSPSTTAVIPAVRDEPKSTPQPAASTVAEPRVARLKVSHVEPWSVTKLAFAVSVALMVVAVVAVTIFWIVLNAVGVWDQINEAVTKVLSDNPSSFDITEYLGFGRLVGLTLVLSAINVILMTALATIAAHLYNLASQLLGGVEVTFRDEQ